MLRRLTTIVAADLAGYSRLMAADEEGTIRRLRATRADVIDPALENAGGRIIKTMGDGLLLEFSSPVEAARCVIAIQRDMAARETGPEHQRLRFRIGINSGDVVIDGDDVLGDGVNVAARLESLAPPGGVAISRNVFEQIRGRVAAELTPLGSQQVKNLPDPVDVWWVAIEDVPTPAPTKNNLSSMPSIVILPFDNLSADPEQEFLADGIVEDATTELSRFRSLFVIARNSAFSYKGTSKDVREIARELGVRYVVEGSVRRGGNRLRVTAQLIEAETGRHLWANRWDRTMEDLFELQDEMTRAIVTCIEPELGAHERAIARKKPTENLTAWELYQRGNSEYLAATEEGYDKTYDYCTRSIQADSNFALPHGVLARLHFYRVLTGKTTDRDADIASGLKHARTAVEIDNREECAFAALSVVQAVAGRVSDARVALEQAEALNQNNAVVHLARLIFHLTHPKLEYKKLLAASRNAIRFSPRDPNLWSYWYMLAFALAGKDANLTDPDVLNAFETSAACENADHHAYVTAALANIAQDRPEAARKYLAGAKKLDPSLSLSKWETTISAALLNHAIDQWSDYLQALIELDPSCA